MHTLGVGFPVVLESTQFWIQMSHPRTPCSHSLSCKHHTVIVCHKASYRSDTRHRHHTQTGFSRQILASETLMLISQVPSMVESSFRRGAAPAHCRSNEKAQAGDPPVFPRQRCVLPTEVVTSHTHNTCTDTSPETSRFPKSTSYIVTGSSFSYTGTFGPNNGNTIAELAVPAEMPRLCRQTQ